MTSGPDVDPDVDPDVAPNGPDAFKSLLRAFLLSAADSGVDVDGVWECRGDDGDPDWEVEVVRLATDADQQGGPRK